MEVTHSDRNTHSVHVQHMPHCSGLVLVPDAAPPAKRMKLERVREPLSANARAHVKTVDFKLVEVTDGYPNLCYEMTRRFMKDIRQALEEDGVVLVKNVVPEEMCERARDAVANHVSKLVEAVKEDFKTQTKYKRVKYEMNGDYRDLAQNSILDSRTGVANLNEVWDLRKIIRTLFEVIYGTRRLVTSVDRAAYAFGGESAETGKGTAKFHVDQKNWEMGFHCLQGALYLNAAPRAEEDWNMKVITKSHLHFDRKCDECKGYKQPPPQYSRSIQPRVKDVRELCEEKGCKEVVVTVQDKGTMIIWDSRTIHASYPPERTVPVGELSERCVFFCSMTPATWSSDDDRAKRVAAVNNLSCTDHRSSIQVKLDPHAKVKQSKVTQVVQEKFQTLVPLHEMGMSRMNLLDDVNKSLVIGEYYYYPDRPRAESEDFKPAFRSNKDRYGPFVAKTHDEESIKAAKRFPWE